MIIVFFADVVSVIAHYRSPVVHARFANLALAPTAYKRRVSFFDAADNTLAFACYKGEAHCLLRVHEKNVRSHLKSDTAGVAV